MLPERAPRLSWPTSMTQRGLAALAEELGVRYIHTDVSRVTDSQASVDFAVKEFGALHVAHLNAGVTTACGMGDDFDPEAYRQAMSINLDGVVYGIAAARPAIIGSGGGTIVATASMAGLVAVPFDPIYSANKHAVVGLVRSLGDLYASEGIRIHALCPSFAYTNIITGSEQSLLDMGFPILEVSDVVDAVQHILDAENHRPVLVRDCQARERGPFAFGMRPVPASTEPRRSG